MLSGPTLTPGYRRMRTNWTASVLVPIAFTLEVSADPDEDRLCVLLDAEDAEGYLTPDGDEALLCTFVQLPARPLEDDLVPASELPKRHSTRGVAPSLT